MRKEATIVLTLQRSDDCTSSNSRSRTQRGGRHVPGFAFRGAHLLGSAHGDPGNGRRPGISRSPPLESPSSPGRRRPCDGGRPRDRAAPRLEGGALLHPGPARLPDHVLLAQGASFCSRACCWWALRASSGVFRANDLLVGRAVDLVPADHTRVRLERGLRGPSGAVRWAVPSAEWSRRFRSSQTLFPAEINPRPVPTLGLARRAGAATAAVRSV